MYFRVREVDKWLQSAVLSKEERNNNVKESSPIYFDYIGNRRDIVPNIDDTGRNDEYE